MKIRKNQLQLAKNDLSRLLEVPNTKFSEQVLKCLSSVEQGLNQVRQDRIPEMTDEVKAYKAEIDVLYKSHTVTNEEGKPSLNQEGFDKSIEELNIKMPEAHLQITKHDEAFLISLDELIEIEPIISFKNRNILPNNMTAQQIMAVNSYTNKSIKSE